MCAWWIEIASSTQMPRTRSSRSTSPTTPTVPTTTHARLDDHAPGSASGCEAAESTGGRSRRSTYAPPVTGVASVAIQTPLRSRWGAWWCRWSAWGWLGLCGWLEPWGCPPGLCEGCPVPLWPEFRGLGRVLFKPGEVGLVSGAAPFRDGGFQLPLPAPGICGLGEDVSPGATPAPVMACRASEPASDANPADVRNTPPCPTPVPPAVRSWPPESLA